MSETIEVSLKRLLDIEAIRALKYRYARLCDDGYPPDELAAMFTEDGVWQSDLFGTYKGREAIRAWITETMSTFPGNLMPEFPIDWYVVDEERGWIVCQVENRMQDPGDGTVHQEANVTILHYAGAGKWSYEEDVYNPAHFGTMVKGWLAARDAAAAPG